MIEALACGTPVIARARGSVPEVIEHGKTGFVIKDVEEAACAARNLSALRRKDCRQSFEQRFTATRMAKDYVAVYERLVEARRSPRVKPKRKPSRATPEREAQPDGPPKRHLRRPSFLLNERDH